MAAVTGEQVLDARVARAVRELEAVSDWLNVPEVRARIPAVQFGTYVTVIRELRTELGTYRGPQAQADVTTWRALQRVDERAQRLKTEVFALVTGVFFALAGLDADLTTLVDRLLDGLSGRTGLPRRVIVAPTAEGESLDHTLDLVRVRFPGTTPWEIPIAAHELGHHVARELRPTDAARFRERPLLDLVEKFAERARGNGDAEAADPARLTRQVAEEAARGHELVADAYATFALGAAYPLTCIALRVDPADATTETPTHPSWTRRVALMAATLREMSAISGLPRYANSAQNVVVPLCGTLVGGPLDERARAGVQRLGADVARTLHRTTESLMYDGGDQALQVADAIAATVGRQPPPGLPDGCTVAHVLNGAWRWRLRNWDVYAQRSQDVDAVVLSFALAARI